MGEQPRHRQTVKTLEEFDRRLVHFYTKRTGYPRAEPEKEIRTERPLTPAAAHRFNLVHSYIGDVQWRGGKQYGGPIVDRAVGRLQLGGRAGRVWGAPFA